MKILLAGCGQLGRQLGQQLQDNGDEVVGIKRHATPTLFTLRLADLSDEKALPEETPDYDVIVFSVTPSSREESAYQQVYQTILPHVVSFAQRHQRPPLFIFISSTGVYGQQNGEWVNEKSPTEPEHYSGKWVLFGEQYLQQHLDNYIIVRFSGIYGDNRRWLINQAISGKAIQKSPPIWTNRIHEADCVGSLAFLINAYRQGQALDNLYLISDDTPVSRYEVCAFICQLSGQPLPHVEHQKLTDKCNKRCDNSKIKSLGYDFIYPTFEHGYRAILTTS